MQVKKVMSFFKRFAVFALFWLLLTNGEWQSLVIGVFFIAAASYISLWLAPSANQTDSFSYQYPDTNTSANTQNSTADINPLAINVPKAASIQSFKITALPAFIPYFIYQSVKGAIETARLAIAPDKTAESGFLLYSTDLPEGSVKWFLIHIMILLPGTASVESVEGGVIIHAIDKTTVSLADFRACEVQVCRLFKPA